MLGVSANSDFMANKGAEVWGFDLFKKSSMILLCVWGAKSLIRFFKFFACAFACVIVCVCATCVFCSCFDVSPLLTVSTICCNTLSCVNSFSQSVLISAMLLNFSFMFFIVLVIIVLFILVFSSSGGLFLRSWQLEHSYF